MANAYSIETVFKLIDQVSAPTSRAGKALDKLGIKSKTVSSALKHDFDKAAVNINKISSAIGKFAKKALLGLIPAGIGVGLLTKQFIEFDSQLYKAGSIFSDLNPLADDFKTRLDAIGKAARNVAAATEFNAEQTASALATMAMAGIKSEQAISLLPRVADMATAAGVDLDKAVGMAADSLNVFGKMTDDPLKLAENFQYVSDIMLRTANLASMDLNLMYEATGAGGAQFKKANQRIEDFGAAVDILAANTIKGSEAGTKINTIMTRLSAPVTAGQEALKKLGIRTKDAQGNLLNFVDIIEQLKKSFTGMGDAQQSEYIKAIFGQQQLTAASALINAGVEGFRAYSRELDKSAGSTAKAAEVMRQSIKNKLAVMGSAATELGFKFAEAFKDKAVVAIESATAAIENFDVAPLVGMASAAADGIMKFAGMLAGAVKTAWQFRYVIIAILGPIAAYHLVLMIAIPIIALFTKLSFLAAITMGTQATALGMLKKGTIEYLVVDKLFTAATAVRNFVLNLLTGGTLAQTAATAKMAVAAGTATKGQWLLNAAMAANPIGLVIGVILVLILVLKELFSNWDNIKKAFQDGGILAGILRIGGTIVSAILAPIQALLEMLSKIPVIGDLAGKGADKIQEFRNFLKGTSDIANTAQNRKAAEKPPADEIDELLKKYEVDIPGLETAGIGDYPGFGIPGIGEDLGPGGKSKFHGVMDISGGAIPTVDGIGSYTAASSIDNSPPPGAAASALASYVIGIAATLQRIEGAVSNIDRGLPLSARTELPAMGAPITAAAARTIDAAPRATTGGGGGSFDYSDPRTIAPITQAERTAYSFEERRETIVIEVAAEKGTAARIVRAPRDVDIRLVASGGNA